ncbi:MAG TPA: STAS domain-containing protein [Solirubrobacteraceae bacterium]|jgi:anti-anti-sigma factor
MVRPTPFEITEETQGVITKLSVAGELDLGTAPLLAQRVEEKLGEAPTTLTLDLSELAFMDSSGLRLIIEFADRAQREAWKLTLVPSRHEAANTVLRVTGADAALPFDDR